MYTCTYFTKYEIQLYCKKRRNCFFNSIHLIGYIICFNSSKLKYIKFLHLFCLCKYPVYCFVKRQVRFFYILSFVCILLCTLLLFLCSFFEKSSGMSMEKNTSLSRQCWARLGNGGSFYYRIPRLHELEFARGIAWNTWEYLTFWNETSQICKLALVEAENSCDDVFSSSPLSVNVE